jgi:hypothetical protein
MDTNTQDTYDADGKGTFDANKKGPMFNKPVAQPGVAQRNMKSLTPGGGVWDGNPATGQKKNATEEESDVKEAVTLDITPFIDALFEGQELSEDFKERTRIIFESALNEKVTVIEEAILQSAKEVIEEQVAQNVAIITEKVDDYLGLVVREWLNENKLQVEQGFRTEIAENFIVGLKQLFENSYVQVPEEKADLVDELFAENRKLEESINELIAKNMELQENNLVNECATVFVELSSDLTDTEVEKLASLSEGLEFSDVNTYKTKLGVLKESYFKGNATSNSNNAQMISEDVSGQFSAPNTANVDANIKMYIDTISRHLKNTNSKF